ncbi:uncharacterized protein BXZ73DRAFT_41841 [Epithele typhae]|uniref:uncharacterized protein n=1 Tax=Epithele typhae TaxID=378194 RepID=UPI0020072095|nr:uncharacterized protein BXZ73DRAFT_41841 [Epithele typhae]KAH9941795.1 hypothetical protein BXZ73DRAFT_41841 [Epithele typhae]
MFTPPPSPDPRPPLRRSEPSTSSLSASSSTPSTPSSLRLSFDDRVRPPPSRSTSPTPVPRIQLTSPKEDPQGYVHTQLAKARSARRIRWTVLAVPLVLVFIALSTRYAAHPAALDLLSPFTAARPSTLDWSLHKRHADPAPVPAESSTAGTSASGTQLTLESSTSSTASPSKSTSPSVTVPATAPVLPTPFPQPFDMTFTTNFSTTGCYAFVQNMTQTSAFRECRPFSLLVQDSNAFITSQQNVTELNAIIWGTCNTDLSEAQCVSNMAWFETNIQTTCKADLAAKNSIVTDALAGLQAYSLMRTAACEIDTAADKYCYLDATQSGDAADLFVYQLPLGLGLPNTSVPSCTACTQRVMGVFANDTKGVAGLQKTYAQAAGVVNNACGSHFVAVATVSGGARARVAGAVLAASVAAVLALGLL